MPMLRIARRLLPVVAAAGLAAPAAGGLRDEVEILIRRADLGEATVAVSVRDADSGAELVAFDADTPLMPASNLKLITTGAALHVLGPSFQFQTRLLRDGNRLVVVGDGDPAFGDPDLLELMVVGDQQGLDVEQFTDLWVKPVAALGLESIREIVVDDRIFERRFVHPQWPADQLNRRYCAEVAGLNFHANVVHFFPRPAGGQRPSFALMRPEADWLELTNRATSRDGVHDRNDVWIARLPDSNALTFYGNVRFPYRAPVPVTVHDAPAFFVTLLADRLAAAGVMVGDARVAGDDDPPPAGEVVGPVIATSIETVVTRCNRDSQNLYAECLLKRMAFALTNEPGSWTNGAAVARHVVHERLDNANLVATLAVSDGSGLSRGNRIAAATMTAWLNTFHDDARLGSIFINSLAMAGETGTLAKRFAGTDLHGTTVHAKSGYISGVSCLSGYVTAPDGRRRSFSMLANDLKPGTISAAKKLQERIVSAIAWDLTATVSMVDE